MFTDDPILRALFPSEVAVAATALHWDISTLYPDEQLHVQNAVAKRQREFAAGRGAAREALRQLGVSNISIPVGSDRAPMWPRGIVGSISHCKDYCVAVAGRTDDVAALGVDVEEATPLDAKLVSLICTPDETAWAQQIAPPARTDWPKLFFSAKESVYKTFFPIYRTYLDFLDVTVHFQPFSETFIADVSPSFPDREQTRFHGKYGIGERCVYTAVTHRYS